MAYFFLNHEIIFKMVVFLNEYQFDRPQATTTTTFISLMGIYLFNEKDASLVLLVI